MVFAIHSPARFSRGTLRREDGRVDGHYEIELRGPEHGCYRLSAKVLRSSLH